MTLQMSLTNKVSLYYEKQFDALQDNAKPLIQESKLSDNELENGTVVEYIITHSETDNMRVIFDSKQESYSHTIRIYRFLTIIDLKDYINMVQRFNDRF